MSIQKSTLEQVKRAGAALVDARKALADDFKGVMDQMTSAIITQPAGRDLDRQFASVKDMARLAHEMGALEERVKDILLSAMALAERRGNTAQPARTQSPRLLSSRGVSDAVVVEVKSSAVKVNAKTKAKVKAVPKAPVANDAKKEKKAPKSVGTDESAPTAIAMPVIETSTPTEPKKIVKAKSAAAKAAPKAAKTAVKAATKAPVKPAKQAQPKPTDVPAKKAKSALPPNSPSSKATVTQAAPVKAAAPTAALSSNESKVFEFVKTRLNKKKPAALMGKDVGAGAGIPVGSVSLALKQLVAKGKLVLSGDGMYTLA